MRNRATKHDEDRTPPDLMVASTLQMLNHLPNDRRASALQSTVEHLRGLYTGLPITGWWKCSRISRSKNALERD